MTNKIWQIKKFKNVISRSLKNEVHEIRYIFKDSNLYLNARPKIWFWKVSRRPMWSITIYEFPIRGYV